jgi:4-carboxymuconolactone decarboxylase
MYPTKFRRKPMRLHRSRLHGAAILLVAACTITAFAQTAATKLPADINPDSRARLPYLQRKNLDEAGQKIFDVLPGASKEGVLSGPLAFAAYNPAVAKALFDLHNAAVAGTLSAHVRELAIMVACRETNYNLEWNGHEATALKSGVDAKVIDIVRRGAPLPGISEEDATVIRFGRQLYTDRKIDSATYAKAVELFTQRGVMDMVAIMNTYAVSGFYGIAVDEQAAAGKTPLERLK